MTAYLDTLGLICALGQGKQTVARRLFAGDQQAMRAREYPYVARPMMTGAVVDPLPPAEAVHAGWDTRTNRLLRAACDEIEEAIARAAARYGRHRIGIVLGTSTTGIAEATHGIDRQQQHGTFDAGYHYAQQELSAPAAYLAERLQIRGPAYVISTACTSSGRALLSARRLLDMEVCDAVICGGVDSLCAMTLNGFSALEAISASPCNPFSRHRDGINIGEAAALFVMTREPLQATTRPLALLGAGASSDAHHISAPEPEGRGALAAIDAALGQAGLAPEQIDYLNLHGTATRHNDTMESRVVAKRFGQRLACSSTKPLTGHTLGAASALEAAFCWLTMSEYNPESRLPPHRWDGEADPELPAIGLVGPDARLTGEGPRRMMSNSFAFGGNNVSLILGDAP